MQPILNFADIHAGTVGYDPDGPVYPYPIPEGVDIILRKA